MERYIDFIVDGECQPKQRPRFRRTAKFVQTYTPAETLAYQDKVRKAYQEKTDYKFSDVPLRLEITIYTAIPKSYSKVKAERARQHIIKPTKKPDIDNCCKSIMDSLNKVAFDDDKQVTDLIVRKRYAEQPYTLVSISEVKE